MIDPERGRMGALSALAAEGERPRKRDGSDRRSGDVQMTSENVFEPPLLRSLVYAMDYPSYLPLQMSYVHGPQARLARQTRHVSRF